MPETSSRLLLLLLSMRPRQWAKNVFVLAPLLFALRLDRPGDVLRALAAVLLFCLVAGPVYVLNDIVDRQADAHHPEKRHRPIASGALSPSFAGFLAGTLAASSLCLAAAWNLSLAGILALYLASNLVYSFFGKRVPVLDVLMIAFGFILRVVGGAFSIQVPVSAWILSCTFLLAVYLGLGKRLHEMAVVGDGNGRTRLVLSRYNARLTRILFALSGVASLAAFTLYTLSERAQLNFGTRSLVFTAPFVAVGLARFALLARDSKRNSSPTESLLTDPIVLVTALTWAASAVGIIYFKGVFR